MVICCILPDRSDAALDQRLRKMAWGAGNFIQFTGTPRMRRHLALTCALGAACLITGCAQFPQLDATVTDAARSAPYPDLVPLDSLRSRMDFPAVDADTLPTIEERVADLKSRKEDLQGDVIDSATRQRMQAGVRQ